MFVIRVWLIDTNDCCRFRGRTADQEQAQEQAEEHVLLQDEQERLPANTRFPPRSRASATPAPVSATTDTPITRIRGLNLNLLKQLNIVMVVLKSTVKVMDGF